MPTWWNEEGGDDEFAWSHLLQIAQTVALCSVLAAMIPLETSGRDMIGFQTQTTWKDRCPIADPMHFENRRKTPHPVDHCLVSNDSIGELIRRESSLSLPRAFQSRS